MLALLLLPPAVGGFAVGYFDAAMVAHAVDVADAVVDDVVVVLLLLLLLLGLVSSTSSAIRFAVAN